MFPHAPLRPLCSTLQMQVVHESDVACVVGAVHHFCTEHALGPLVAAHVATAASELANNLWMHSQDGGSIDLRWLPGPRGGGIELRCRDAGPGIADIELAMTEGFSTGGGLGCGLPGVRRLMDEFDIRSAPGLGTCVRARKWSQSPPPPPSPFEDIAHHLVSAC